jgi:hypothetical protein
MDMPKMSERDRLAELEARHRKVASELDQARRAVRDRYAGMVIEMAVERISERDFREIVSHAIRVGGAAALAVLKPLPAGPA